jgi:hypothetical protein
VKANRLAISETTDLTEEVEKGTHLHEEW